LDEVARRRILRSAQIGLLRRLNVRKETLFCGLQQKLVLLQKDVGQLLERFKGVTFSVAILVRELHLLESKSSSSLVEIVELHSESERKKIHTVVTSCNSSAPTVVPLPCLWPSFEGAISWKT
jgi:hypothetical protein